MAFLEDDDAVRAFEAALSFVEQYSIDTSVFTASPSTSGAAFSPSLASGPVDDMELLSPSLVPLAVTLGGTYASLGGRSDTSIASPSSPAFQLSKEPTARLELGLPTPGQVSTKRKTVARGRKKTPGPKKPVTRGDPNRARNERKIELAYLREKVSQLELEMRALKLHPRTHPRALRQDGEKKSAETVRLDGYEGSTMSVYDPVQVPTTKMAKGLESLLQKRAKQQVVECSSLSQSKKSKAYREVDTVFAANGLATMETTHRDARMREGGKAFGEPRYTGHNH
ncbi:hypothetical protein PF010_g7596 [Phytophthora fragariae]|uniref:Uncharacterized protein n=1 Tax=Phytophthora fragariae TaxID=53985 RepID=A0A6G0LGX3_9STRA|nr:hypothetical protein PF010_g7596 [Phytophthora fragariae]